VRKSNTYPFVLVVMIAVFAALASTGLIVSAQNSNSSTTAAPANTNTSKPRRHRPKPKPKASTEATTDTSATATTMPAAQPRKGRCDPNQQEQTDLSGTYTGKMKMGDEAATDATLTITGNNFTMNAGSNTHSGRIVAVTTCGYTAVTVMPEGATHAHSLRAKKMGNGLTLMSVPGETEKVMFTTGGGMRRPRKHTMKKPAAPAATTTNPPQQ
jgi:hypothetical protein